MERFRVMDTDHTVCDSFQLLMHPLSDKVWI